MTDVRDNPRTDAGAAVPGDGGSPRTGVGSLLEDRTWWVIGVLVAARVAALGYLLLSHQESVDGGLTGDVHRYVEMATARGLPYRDFQVEYPPVTYLLIRLLTRADLAWSIAAVAVSQFVCDLGIAALLRWAWDRRAAVAYLALGVPLMAFPFVYARVDLFTALLAVGGVALVRKGRDGWGGGVLAVAVGAKLWPLAVAPILLVERRVKGIVAFVTTGIVLFAVWVGIGGGAGPGQVLSFREASGWQVESVPGILWHLRDPARIKFESGAFRTGVMPPWARPTLTLVSIGFVAIAWWLAARRFNRGVSAGHRLVFEAEAPLAGVLALLLFAPILSPQYIVWMLPFAALLAARGDRVVAAITAAITAVTTLSYVFVLPTADGELYGIVTVIVRNALLIALLAVSFQTLAGVRDRRAPRSSSDVMAAATPA